MKKTLLFLAALMMLAAGCKDTSKEFQKSRSYTYSQCVKAHGTWWSRTGQCVYVPKESHG